MNVILVGMPGSGKSTVSGLVAEKLGYKLIDTDCEIVKRYGDIGGIFAEYGEEYFRDAETQTVKEVCEIDGAVISTGGGCLLRSVNAETFKKCGKIVYLKTSVAELLKRLRGDCSRPLLAGDKKARLEELQSTRAKIYEENADVIIRTDGLTAKEVADAVIENI